MLVFVFVFVVVRFSPSADLLHTVRCRPVTVAITRCGKHAPSWGRITDVPLCAILGSVFLAALRLVLAIARKEQHESGAYSMNTL